MTDAAELRARIAEAEEQGNALLASLLKGELRNADRLAGLHGEHVEQVGVTPPIVPSSGPDHTPVPESDPDRPAEFQPPFKAPEQ